ncbi:hypothetical protein P7K49_031462, partial [Saguinus oedipus]
LSMQLASAASPSLVLFSQEDRRKCTDIGGAPTTLMALALLSPMQETTDNSTEVERNLSCVVNASSPEEAAGAPGSH